MSGGIFDSSGNALSQSAVATVNLSLSNGEWTGTATGLTGTAPNIFSSPITTIKQYTYTVVDGNGCRADAPVGSAFPTGSGSGIFELSNSFNVVYSYLKTFFKVYDTNINGDSLLGYSDGMYPNQASSNFWVTPLLLATFWVPGPNPNSLWRNTYKSTLMAASSSSYNNDIALFRLYSQNDRIIDAADFRAITSGGNTRLNGDGEFTSPNISSPGAIEDTSGSNATPAITFTNSQTLNGTVADQNNYITVTIPYNLTIPANGVTQKVMVHFVGSSYTNSSVI